MPDSTAMRIYSKLRTMKGASLADLVGALPEQFMFTDEGPESAAAEAILPLIVDYGLVEVYDNDGLVATDELRNRWDLRPNHRLYISPLAVKLEEIIAPPPANRAIFGDVAEGDWPEVLVLMPFSANLQPVFEDHILKVVVDNCGLSCARADQFMAPNAIIHDIWSALNRASLVIADCTDMNANVFYEIGVAHTLGKNTILIAQSMDHIPFDLRHLRIIAYDFTPRGMLAFEAALKSAVQATT